MQRSWGLRSTTRKKFTKNVRDRGNPPISHMLQKFEVGQKANIVIDPSVQKGQPHHRFHGLTGVVTGMQGEAFTMKVKVGNALKDIVIRPEHMTMVK
jgi:large subunit ribosomal protein L21e